MDKGRIIAIIFFITIILAFFVLRYNNYENKLSSTSIDTDCTYKIYLITIDKKDQHCNLINQGAADMASLLGVNYLWEAPEEKDTRAQIELLNKAVEDGANLIMLAVNDPIAIVPAIEDAKERNVGIIYVDSPAYEEAILTLSTNNYSAGVTAGGTMIMELEGLGITSGSIGIIGVNEVTDSTIRRENGFRDMIEADGRFTLLNTVYAEGDPIASEEAAAGFLSEHADLVGIFGTNEGSTVGVGNAIQANNNRIVGIGFDKSAEVLRLVKEGSLQAVIAQNPYTMGYLGMAEAVAALNGYDTGPPSINTGVSIIRRRN